MHPSALKNAKLFFDTYSSSFKSGEILEIGSQDVNGSLRNVAPNHMGYIGVDFTEGKGVDVITQDPYRMPFEDSRFDIVVSNSCFEHSELFWLLFLDVMRLLKPNGLLYINVPSNADFHRYPVDCWRFYPDSGKALVTWAKHNGLNTVLLESFTSKKLAGIWNDYVAVFVKDESFVSLHKARMMATHSHFSNGQIYGDSKTYNLQIKSDDQLSLTARIKRRFWKNTERKAYARIVDRRES
jgi:SAM-dependent methyltransferase